MKIKVSELIGPTLDWVVHSIFHGEESYDDFCMRCAEESYINNWAQGGEIIDQEGISLIHQKDRWAAQTDDDVFAYGPTPLIAAMRCFVSSRLGDEVEVPEELV